MQKKRHQKESDLIIAREKEPHWRSQLANEDALFIENTIKVHHPNIKNARDQELYTQYYQLLSALEHDHSMYQEQQKVLDDLVDLFKDTSEKVDLLYFHLNSKKNFA